MATILDSLIGSCAKKLQEIITEEAILILGVKEDLRELQEKMEQIRCFISDVERRGMEDSSIHNWISRLKDAMAHEKKVEVKVDPIGRTAAGRRSKGDGIRNRPRIVAAAVVLASATGVVAAAGVIAAAVGVIIAVTGVVSAPLQGPWLQWISRTPSAAWSQESQR
ncbi:hypothetical protein OsJ_25340 [Oryza sativa Japonica Group]|uniref:Disease resistance N-terminal domain-containing protein n=1 Tax=Oryza sativa subsp. japonica TaxID=39947 RepID=A3BMS0_ORYSJ|nr:hypothetical protein OsJ_25340 [Oryza sativa Japonica Group]